MYCGKRVKKFPQNTWVITFIFYLTFLQPVTYTIFIKFFITSVHNHWTVNCNFRRYPMQFFFTHTQWVPYDIPNTDVPDFFFYFTFLNIKIIKLLLQTIPTLNDGIKRDYSNQLPKTVQTGQKIDSLAKSLASKGCVYRSKNQCKLAIKQ